MKLSASINFYNAEELLIQAVRCIRPLVEHLSIVYQETSNWGNVISERAKKAIEQLKSEGLVDDFYCYEPNSSFNASENEFQKRQIGLDLAKTAGASHFLLMDADEFYIPKQFLKVKEIIRTSDISYSCVRSYFYIHQSIYRSELPDTTNVCFIAKITPELSFEYQGAFPAENVDPTRRLVNSSGRFKFFDANDICMHHMNFVRESFKSKLVNTSSAANPDFIRKEKNALNDWRWPNDFVFPNKPKYKIVEVEDVFQLQKIKYVYQAQPKKKVLLTNYFIREFTGSEMAIFDLTREFLKRGYDVTIGAFIFSDPLLSEFASLGVTLLDLNNASTEHFSLIWAQHFITLDTCLIDSGITADKIIYSSLSPYESLESPPASVKYVNLFLANSSETKNVLVSMGLDECDVIIFPNPVNQSFFSKKKINSQGLKRLAIVSNHIPTEIEQVAEQLRQKGVEVKEFGMLHEFVLITPEVLNNFDAVITIGRTVQYCLAMGIPIYCYDRFGGPGWINIDNIDRAALYNFSGRCVGTKKQADDIESELINNFETTQTQAKFYEEYAKLHFDLENQLDRVLGSLISGQKTDIEQCPKTVLNIINRQRKFTQDLIRNILHNNHIISEKDHILVTKDYQLHAQSQQHHKYKKLWTTRLLKPLIKTEQALSSANTLRKGFRKLVKEKGSIGKAYQFLRRLRKDESMKEVKKYLKTGVVTGGSSLNKTFEILDGGNSSNENGFYASLFSQTGKSNQYVNMRENINLVKSDIKLIAFYLPQFHPIPENDKAWGKGFTEWTNVSKAIPQYIGHHQPKLPDELGFYDLRLIEVQKRQIELAKSYGIYGFCYHHYWFDGKRVMDRPIEQILAHPELDFPFCINWANENWTKRWDGRDADVLLAQNHSELDDIAFIEDAARYMRDSRYIRIDDKPLLMLYRPSLLVDPKATGERWRTWCRENGIGELYLVITHSFEPIDPETIGFDAAVEFAPNSFPLTNVTNKMRSSFLNSNFDGVLYDYISAIDYSESYRVPTYTKFRGVCPRWDNEARKPGKGAVLIGSNPVEYGKWLQSICRFTKNNFEPSKQLVFINAWNEWAEGAYLEPDRKYGYAYLEATRNSLLMTELSTNQKIAVVVHAFYPDVFEEIAKYVMDISQSIKLFVTTTEHNEIAIKKIASKSNLDVDIIIVKNKGRDMLPFLKALPIIKAAGYPFILKIHTKKSKHRADGEIWRSDLYEKLLKPERFEKALSVLSTNLNIGVLGPEGHIVDMNTYWGSNKHAVLSLVEKMNVAKEKVLRVPFVAGSMFYARIDALERLLELGLTDEDFEEESGQIDGTLAHALERLIGVSAICNQQIIASIDGETNYVKNYGFVN